MEGMSAQVCVVYASFSVTGRVVLRTVAGKPAMETLPQQREDWLEAFAVGPDWTLPCHRTGVRDVGEH